MKSLNLTEFAAVSMIFLAQIGFFAFIKIFYLGTTIEAQENKLISKTEEPFSTHSLWGRVLVEKWNDNNRNAKLKSDIERFGSFNFWEQHFQEFLPLQKKKAALLKEQRLAQLNKCKTKFKVNGRRAVNVRSFNQWIQDYMEQPFKGFNLLHLQSNRNQDFENVMSEIETEYDISVMRMCFHYLQQLKYDRNIDFFGESTWTDYQCIPETVLINWKEEAKNVYIPLMRAGYGVKDSQNVFMMDLELALDSLDVYMALRKNEK